MTTSYSKNIHVSNLLVYYTLDSQISSCMSINPNETGLFEGSFFWGTGRSGQFDPLFIFPEELI